MEPNDGLNNKQNETEETVITSSSDEAVIPSTEMPQSMKQVPVDNSADDSIQDKPKKISHAMVIGMVFLAILAIGGIGFGIWAWTTGFAQNMKHEEEIMDLRSQLAEATQPVEEEVVVVDDNATDRISNELAQNLIDPYMGSFTYLNDIFDHEFNENTKFYVAFKNLSFNWFSEFGKSAIGADIASVRYDDINEKYKYFFGGDKDLDKTNYQEGYDTFTYETDSLGGGKFIVERLGGGGTMSALFSIIKDAYYTDEGVTVEVYHDKINVCVVEGADPNYCVRDMGYHTSYDDEMKRIIDNNKERVPIYAMIFKDGGDHYYLSAINKL